MKFSQSDKEAIVAAIHTKKATMTELAKRYGVSIAGIGYVFKTMTGKALKPQLSKSEKEAIVAALQSGKVSIKEIATRYGVQQGTISHTYKQLTGKALHPHRLSQRDRENIVTELQSGKTPKELAIKYGVGSSYIGQIYKDVTGMLRILPNLSQQEKETIVTELKAEKASMRQLAKRYGVNRSRISSVFEEMTGSSFSVYKASNGNGQVVTQQHQRKMKLALKESLYRAWHTEEKIMYPVVGLDWFNQKILIAPTGVPEWYPMDLFIITQYSWQRDHKRTPDHPKGHDIYVGDIVQFPILLKMENGEAQETIVKDVVAFDRESGMFIVAGLDDPLALHNDECEVIGTVYDNPKMVTKETYEAWCAFSKDIKAVAPSIHEHYNQ